VGELKEDGTFIRGVCRYPTLGAKFYAVGLAEINAIFLSFESMNSLLVNYRCIKIII